MDDLVSIAKRLVSGGRGILAADESPGTMSARLHAVGVEPSVDMRRDYRELLVTTPDLCDTVSGVILCDETFRQAVSDGRQFPVALRDLGLLPGIKVDTGAKPLAVDRDETVTEGLDGLRDRLAAYRELGAVFAKWRAVLRIGSGTPSVRAIRANAHALARYAALCQEQGLVPIVEPEVLSEGDHDIARCRYVTSAVLLHVFDEIETYGVARDAMVLKPNMVTAGFDCPLQDGVDTVARETLAALHAAVPHDVAGVAFLSGGHAPTVATARLAGMNAMGPHPWPLTFSFGRALVDPALRAWAGRTDARSAGRAALFARARESSLACRGIGPHVRPRRAPAVAAT